MKHSTNRILTTHVGSLIRPQPLQEFLHAKQGGKPYDEKAYQQCLTVSVTEVVREQADAGIDVVSDGEFGKSISWAQYALERLSGFERRPIKQETANPFKRGADRTKFAEFYAELDAKEAVSTTTEAICVGPIKYTGQAELQRDIDNLKAALKSVKVEEAFLPVAAPASVIPDRKNEYYKGDEDLQAAIAEAMRTEYKMIVDSGFLLQLDDARSAVTFDRMVPPASFTDYRRWLSKQVDILNHAIEGLPADRIRYHVCWGSWPGPHTSDVPLKDIVAAHNIDMIGKGRVEEVKFGGPASIQTLGSRRLSREFGDVIDSVNAVRKEVMAIDKTWDVTANPMNRFCRSDQVNYVLHDIPVTYFSHGYSLDYHMPTDEPQYVDYEHAARSSRFIHDIMMAVATRASRPVISGNDPAYPRCR